MKKILITDDDVNIGNMLEEVLIREGYNTLRAYSGTEALMAISMNKPDLILLDLMLPGLNGEEVLTKISGIPVIVVSAKVEVDNKVALLLQGAADYVTKPFDVRELLARIAVQLRQNHTGAAADMMAFDDLTMNLSTRAVCAKGQTVKLTKTEYAILKLLMGHPSQVMTKAVILDKVCEDTPDCMESSLKVHMSHLRRKLRDAGGKDYIESVWGIGFKMAEV